MKCSLLFVLVSMMTACGIGVAHGKDCQGVNFPEQAQIDGSTLSSTASACVRRRS